MRNKCRSVTTALCARAGARHVAALICGAIALVPARAHAWTLGSQLDYDGCHEPITAEALRNVRGSFATAPAIAPTRDEAALIDHALFVPPILRQRGISQVVLVTSQQHIARAVAAFNAVGIDPVPSTPEVYVPRGRFLEMYLPSEEGRTASEHMLYDLLAWVYYKARGWV